MPSDRGDRPGDVPAADGLEAVEIVVARIGLLEPCRSRRRASGLAILYLAGSKRPVLFDSVAVTSRVVVKLRDARRCSRSGPSTDRTVSVAQVPREGADVHRVLGVAADGVHREGAGVRACRRTGGSLRRSGPDTSRSCRCPGHSRPTARGRHAEIRPVERRIGVVQSIFDRRLGARGLGVAKAGVGAGIAERREGVRRRPSDRRN